MTTFYPFRIEIEFLDRTEYTPDRMKEDGWEFCQKLEQSVRSSRDEAAEIAPSVVFVNRTQGSLIHWGYFAFEVFSIRGFLMTLESPQTWQIC
jgi:hypothetical protein